MARLGWLVWCAWLCACGGASLSPEPAPTAVSVVPSSSAPSPATPAAKPDPLAANVLEAHVRALCSDEMAGRPAGGGGERLAFDYATRELERLGLEVEQQPVPLRNGGTSQNRYVLLTPPVAAGAQLVVVGAHVDHVGVRAGAVYHGAEDNASGVAVVLALAASLSARRSELKRPVLLVLFGAEEVGMVGSRAFVREKVELVKRSAIMINLDMIGRPVADRAVLALPKRLFGIDDRVAVGLLGTRGRPQLRQLVDEVFDAAKLQVVGLEDLPAVLSVIVERIADGRSDSFSFEDVGVPALFFSSGESDDYHQPSDTPDRIDYRLMAERAKAIAELVVRLSRDSRQSWVEAP